MCATTSARSREDCWSSHRSPRDVRTLTFACLCRHMQAAGGGHSTSRAAGGGGRARCGWARRLRARRSSIKDRAWPRTPPAPARWRTDGRKRRENALRLQLRAGVQPSGQPCCRWVNALRLQQSISARREQARPQAERGTSALPTPSQRLACSPASQTPSGVEAARDGGHRGQSELRHDHGY